MYIFPRRETQPIESGSPPCFCDHMKKISISRNKSSPLLGEAQKVESGFRIWQDHDKRWKKEESSEERCKYGVATISRLLKIIGLFCQRALQNRRYSAKETYNFDEPTNRSHPISREKRKGAKTLSKESSQKRMGERSPSLSSSTWPDTDFLVCRRSNALKKNWKEPYFSRNWKRTTFQLGSFAKKTITRFRACRSHTNTRT